MSWLKKLMPAGIRTDAATNAKRRNVPEGLWEKCGGCGAVLYRPELEENLEVCPRAAGRVPRRRPPARGARCAPWPDRRAALPRPEALLRPDQGGAEGHRRARRADRDVRRAEGEPDRGLRLRFRLHGRLDGLGGR